MKKLVLVLLMSFSFNSFAGEYSAICNCLGYKKILLQTFSVKGAVVGGSEYSVGGALQSAATQCLFGLYPKSCRVFQNEKLVYSEE